ncbi:MAG: ABC transporter permease [Acidobacteria bacterium]|nr:ABC transporter permease [Acidobacteriota bacterium]
MQITPSENLRMAIEAVWTNRFRSLLTILGIVIGITTVVTVASLLTGLRKGIVTFFQEFGPDNIFIARFSGDPGSQGTPKEAKRRPLRPEYADLIKRLSPSVDDVSIQMFVPGNVGNRPITAKVPGFESDNVSLVGQTANSIQIQPREFREGRYFTPEEENRCMRVAVIGPLLAEVLYPDGNAVGRTFIIDGAEYTVIGVTAKAKGGFFGENGIDRQATAPLATIRLRYPQLDRFFITVKAKSGLRDSAFEEARATLRKIRRVPNGIDDDFNISTPDSIIKQFDTITGLIVLVSIAISGLGLLVGGIGVMNIMLVSVTERTKEIGIRKALGARRFDIITQFLIEAIALTGAGGILGIIISIAVTALVSALVPSLPSETPSWAIVAGLGVSVAVGLFFGVWPATKASRLDPVEALRYE